MKSSASDVSAKAAEEASASDFHGNVILDHSLASCQRCRNAIAFQQLWYIFVGTHNRASDH
jgi:hypothetical protein